jgi:HEPN domain-containing protein
MEEKRINFLKERAKEFFEEAKELFKKKRYNLSAFNLEQAIQLFVKYLIGKKLGDWPKTHYLSELVPDLARIYKSKEILKFYRENELFFENLEDAYFVSRYFPKKFSENSLSQLFEKSEEFLKLIKKEIKESFYD